MAGYRTRILLAALALALLTGCLGGASRVDPAAATAQAIRAREMATRMAAGLRLTQVAGISAATATAESRLAGLEAARRWPLVLSEGFDRESDLWPLGESTDPLADITWEIADGRYRWQARAKESFVWWAVPEAEMVSDFYLAASVALESGPPDAEQGLVFRLDGDSRYYTFETRGQDQFGLFLFGPDGWEALIDWQASPAIRPGEANRLGVLAQGAQFILIVNDQPVAAWSDDRLELGQAGLIIGLSNPEDEGVWTFDDFELRIASPGSGAAPTANP